MYSRKKSYVGSLHIPPFILPPYGDPKMKSWKLRKIATLFFSFLLFTTSLSVHVENSRVDRRDLTQDNGQEYTSSRNILPLEARSLSDWRLEKVVLVSDIDGNLHGIDRSSGTSLWTLPIEESLVKIHREKEGNQTSEHSNVVWIVEPSHDGLLYYFSPEFGLNRLPTTVKNLVMESPFSLSGDDKIYTGSRKTSLYSLDIHTGQVISQFGLIDDENCPVPNVYRHTKYEGAQTSEDTIMIGKSTYELSIHSKTDSSVFWNLTLLQWGPNNIDTDLIKQNTRSRDNLYFTPFYDKSLLAINNGVGTPAWIARLPSLAVDVFDVYSRDIHEFVVLPHPLNLLNEMQTSEYENDQNLCFINKTVSGAEWFAMSFKNYPALVKLAPLSPYQLALRKHSHGIFEPNYIDQLRNVNVLQPEAEFYLNGVHEFFDLASDTLYQPVAKFQTTKRIGDGCDYEAESLHDAKQIPNLISGIFFPESDKRSLATVDRTVLKEVNSNLVSFHTNLPIRYYETPNAFEDPYRRDPVSLFRRVAEDLLVMSILIGVLLGFRKLSHWVKSRNLRLSKLESTLSIDLPEKANRSVIPENAEKIESAEKPEIIDKPLPLVPDQVFASKINDSGSGVLVPEGVKPVKKVIVVLPDDAEKDDGESDTLGQSEDENEVAATKKKRKRGSRGGKRSSRGKKTVNDDENFQEDENNQGSEIIATLSLVRSSVVKLSLQKKKLQIENNLVISDKILGYGSHGTVVFEGTFENRPVAVKRMLENFYHLAEHEVRLLQESDDHPNVIRYFCLQSSRTENFLYIALELCVCSLEDIVEKSDLYPERLRLCIGSYNELLLQLVKGLHYLHSLKIVHRDLKPQNILVGEVSSRQKRSSDSLVRLLISDFGLCKKLDADQSSFRATTNHAASGTMGWRAPELLLLHDLQEISPQSFVSIHSKQSSGGELVENGSGQGKRLTKAIDVFSLGCVFYYILSGGGHPFGDRYLREGHIINGRNDLSALEKFCPNDYVEATDLIQSMISFSPSIRPSTTQIMKHPYFWTTKKKLEFLLKVSDRFEVERRDPPSPLLLKLEEIGRKVHSGDWHSKFDNDFINNLGKYRKYLPSKLMDLMRAFRNKYHHYNDMPAELKAQMSPVPNGFYQYFNKKFPDLLMEVYSMVRQTLQDENMFEEFF